MAAEKQLLAIKDFIDEFSISRSIFYAEVSKGNLLITKLGYRTYVKRTDANDWLNKLGSKI